MRPVAERILDAFQLTRLSLAFGAVCELWLVTLLTRADPRYVHLPVYHMPLWKALICTGVVSVGLFAFAASLNDLLDIRHDKRFSPDRPLAAGRIRTSSAALLSFGALMAAVICASALGEPALVLTVGVAAAVMFYDVVGKHIPSLGIVTIGLAHAANMFIPNWSLAFTLPVWWSMSHAVAIAASVHRYEDKRPYFGTKRILSLVAAWLFWSIVLLGGGVHLGKAIHKIQCSGVDDRKLLLQTDRKIARRIEYFTGSAEIEQVRVCQVSGEVEIEGVEQVRSGA